MSNKEIELKYVLHGAEVYHRVMMSLVEQGAQHMDTLRQRNSFYDSIGQEFAQARVTLRLRSERSLVSGEKRWVFTAKGKKERVAIAALASRPEFECLCSREEAADVMNLKLRDIIKSLGTDFEAFYSKQIKLINLKNIDWLSYGGFENLRQVWRLPEHGITCELDRTIYPDRSMRYELEIELPSAERSFEVDAWVRSEVLTSCEILPVIKGKARVFFEMLRAKGALQK